MGSLGVFVGQGWKHKRNGDVVTIRNFYTKDRSVLVLDEDGKKKMLSMQALKLNYYPTTMYLGRDVFE